ncbi:nuclear transport factor 2 family protein [Nocardia sp. NBC_01009]|uniref:nuclear transport factor 2 family protein n=1 Tax=Nocardia sp. NBC_01009 TaxID=2975996 RepID=UPI00386C7DAF|nr:nuclear transport factor 2 family protein [Nocardia sp. NBC_01009]
MDRSAVEEWVAGYERAWRTPGTRGLGELFTADIRYLMSPWSEPVVGLVALEAFWEAGRDGPDEAFTMRSEIVAVDGSAAVVRVAVEYVRDQPSRWRDLWVLRFDPDGRCACFEEWPFAPGQPDGH